MAIDKKITYRRNFAGGADMGTVSGGKGFSANTGLSGGYQGGPKGGTGPVGGHTGGDDFRRSKKEFIDNLNKNNASRFEPSFRRRTYKPVTLNTVGARNQRSANPLANLLGFMTGIPFGLFSQGKSGLTSLTNKFNNLQGDFREKFTGYRTQQEYDDARQQRIDLNRINTIQNTLDTKYADGDYSMTDLDERLASLQEGLGIVPNTAAQNAQQFLDFSNQPELSYEGIESLAQPQVFNFNKIGEKLNRDMSYYYPEVGELVADAKTDNRTLLEKLLNPDLDVDEAIDREEEKRKREQELLQEIMST